MTESLPTLVHHVDYYPLKIRVFRNGDIFDRGHVLAVTRKQFKHWIVFLDALTELLRTSTAVRRLFSTQGIAIQHFDELECDGEYVAVETGPFISVPYGQSRFTMRGKSYNPIIRIPDEYPSYLHSAESMDIYLKKEGYGTITGLPYPFDGILSRSPSTSQLHFKHMQSHIPPLKIGGSMEHLNELGTATWLGKNEKWMMGERVTQAPTGAPSEHPHPHQQQTSDNSEDSDTTQKRPPPPPLPTITTTKPSPNTVTKLPRLVTSTRVSTTRRSEAPPPPQKPTSSNTSTTTTTVIQGDTDSGSLPPINNPGKQQGQQQVKQKSIEKQPTEIATVVTSSSVHQKMAPNEEGVQEFQRSYQITETTYLTTPKNEPKPKNEEKKMMKKKERGKWEEKKEAKEDLIVAKNAVNDVDIDEIPKRKMMTSRSIHNLFNDDLDDELEDVLERAQRWETNRKRQKMRQQCTQTSSSLRSISAPRRFVQLFDPDFD